MKELRKMRMTEHCVAKVVPNRTFSVVIHPTVDKILVATGDKWGRLGIWDVVRFTMSYFITDYFGCACYCPLWTCLCFMTCEAEPIMADP